jgi:hypothetical protein
VSGYELDLQEFERWAHEVMNEDLRRSGDNYVSERTRLLRIGWIGRQTWYEVREETKKSQPSPPDGFVSTQPETPGQYRIWLSGERGPKRKAMVVVATLDDEGFWKYQRDKRVTRTSKFAMPRGTLYGPPVKPPLNSPPHLVD